MLLAAGVVSVVVAALSVDAHPQCLDTFPPFEPKEPPLFCNQYRDTGCCGRQQDYQILYNYYYVTLEKLPPEKVEGCKQLLREVMCTKCNPYAAHLFDFESSLKERPLPGLCPEFCQEFYKNCKEAVPFLTSDEVIINSLESEDTFCKLNSLPDPDYCYPNVLTDRVLTAQLDIENGDSRDCLCVQKIADKLHNVVDLEPANDGSGRMFLVLQKGEILIMNEDGSILSKPFLDISSQVLVSDRRGDERGLLGLAFHPEYKENGKFYVYYIRANTVDPSNFKQFFSQVSEYKVSNNRNVAKADSERRIIEFAQPYANHNGGEILFGDDGYFYIFTGDGGNAGDPQNNAQDLSSPLGKVLRIEVNVPENSPFPYYVPSNNPFITAGTNWWEIYAYGMRNPWRCSVDRGHPSTGYGKGRILCGDVGQVSFEEIDIIESGKNYGWKAYEGNTCYSQEHCSQLPEDEHTGPIHDYGRGLGKSITGGYVYRGCTYPRLQGNYIFGDFVSGRLFKLIETSPGSWESGAVRMCSSDICTGSLQNTYNVHIATFGEDEKGELYMASMKQDQYKPLTDRATAIYKLVDPHRRADPQDCD